MKLNRHRKMVIYISASVLLTLALIVNYGLLPMMDRVEAMKKEQEEKEARLVKMLRIIGQRKSYESGILNLRMSEQKLKSVFISGTDPTAIAAELHKTISTLAAQCGVTVTRIDAGLKPERFNAEALKTKPELKDFIRVSVFAQVRCTPPQLAMLISALEADPRLILIQRLEVRSWNVGEDKVIAPNITLCTYQYAPEKPIEPPAKNKTVAQRAGGGV